jgi:hypothetical protein
MPYNAVTGHFVAELLNAVRNCSRHGVVTAGLTLERPGNVITSLTAFIILGESLIATLTVDDF